MTAALKWITILLGIVLVGGIAGYFIYKNEHKEPDVVVIDSQAVVEEIQLLGKLELVKYKMKDVFSQQMKEKVPAKYGWWEVELDSKILIIVAGEAVGCIDLAKIKASDVQIVEDTVTVQIPSPEICYFKIDHQNTRVMNVENDFWDYRKSKEVRLIEKALEDAELQVQKNAIEQGILTETAKQAEPFIKALFQKFGFAKVVLKQQPIEGAGTTVPTAK